MPDRRATPGTAYVGTCDAGGCHRVTEAVVCTSEGWLSVCRAHGILELAEVGVPRG